MAKSQSETFCEAYHRECDKKIKVNCINEYFWAASKTPNKRIFLDKMQVIKELNEHAHNYLMEIPLHHLVLHAIDIEIKCGHIMNNENESTNFSLKPTRSFPRLQMVEAIRGKFTKKIVERHEQCKT